MRFDLSKFLFYGISVILALSLAFAWGYRSHRAQDGLYRWIESIVTRIDEAFSQASEEAATALKVSPEHFLQPSRITGSGVTVNQAEDHGNEWVFLSGFFDGNNELRLIRRNGEPIARWPLRYSEIFAGQTHRKPFATDWNVDTHGALVMEDGSVVFNFEYGGTAKLDRCGSLVWRVDAATHHSVERAEGGGFWVPIRRGNRQSSPPDFYPFEPNFKEDFIARISADGKILNEVSVPRLFYDSGLEALLTATGRQFPKTGEIVHLNKIAELPSALAEDFPDFRAGDLLLSIRDHNAVFVVDPDNWEIKWVQSGPWIRQHDPEFVPGGKIAVFNNNVYVESGRFANQVPPDNLPRNSNIILVDPQTRDPQVAYGDESGQEFVTSIRGKHEWTPRDGLLITEFEAGRVFEVDAGGAVIWEFINRYDDELVAEITEARLYAEDYFTVTDWECDS